MTPQDLRIIREAIREETERIGYGIDATLSYKARDKSEGRINTQRYTKLMGILAKNGELEPQGAGAWRLKDQLLQEGEAGGLTDQDYEQP
jgi:hypothetical protein